GSDRHLAPAQVTLDLVVGPIQRISPPTTTGGADPDHLTGGHRFGVGQGIDLALTRTTRVDGDLKRVTCLPTLQAPARENGPVRDRHEVRVLAHPDVFLVAQATAVSPGSAGV